MGVAFILLLCLPSILSINQGRIEDPPPRSLTSSMASAGPRLRALPQHSVEEHVPNIHNRKRRAAKPQPQPEPTENSSPTPNNTYKVVCYYTNYAWYRNGIGKYSPRDIDPQLCTHIVYGFAVLDPDQLFIKPSDNWADIESKLYEKVTALKKRGVKVSIAIGGWLDSAGDKYSRMVNSPTSRRRFIEHVLQFIYQHGFDGLELDWEFPKCWQLNCNKGPESDKDAFAALVRELRGTFKPLGLLLSAAVPPTKHPIDAGYNVPVMSENLDWISVKSYDYHGHWDKKTGHSAPLYAQPDDDDYTFSVNFTIHYWISHGADSRKLVLGIPMFGNSFSLNTNSDNGLYAYSSGPGESGEQSKVPGILTYYEICDRIRSRGWEVVRDPEGSMGPYARHGDQWVAFDDPAMVRRKAEYVRHNNLAGVMIFSLDYEDFRNNCGGGKYPLLRTINTVLRQYPDPGPDNSLVSAGSPMKGPDCIGAQPHPTDCTKYYVCVNGKSAQRVCPTGLHFDVKEHMCDLPQRAACFTKAPAPTETSTAKAVTTPVIQYHTTEVHTTEQQTTEQRTTEQQTTEQRTTEQQTTKPQTTTTSTVPQSSKVVCYFTNWSWYRQGLGKYLPQNIDTSLCTHIVYAFASLEPKSLTVQPKDQWTDLDNDFFSQVTRLRDKGVKVLLGLGGWGDSQGDKYSRLVNDVGARARFIAHLSEFLRRYNFDGLNLHWEYPTCWQLDCNAGPASDKEGFAALVTELSRELKPRGLLMSAIVSRNNMVVEKAYDVKTLAKHLDWLELKAFDYRGSWDKRTGHGSPLYYTEGDISPYMNVNFSVHYWLDAGVPREKLVLGIPFHGQTFTLEDPSRFALGAPARGPGNPGPYTSTPGTMAFYEICELVHGEGWKVEKPSVGTTAYHDTQWVSYEDVSDIQRKTQFIKDLGLGGAMVWSLDFDDFNNICGCGSYPLLRALHHGLRGSSTSQLSQAATDNCTENVAKSSK